MDRAVSVRAPLRISLGGGGTDLPSYYRENGGFVLSSAIDRYIRVRIRPATGDRYRLDHLEVEEVEEPGAIEHPILRAAFGRHWPGGPVELVSDGAVPPGTGLGSSGSYTVAAVKALVLAAGRDMGPAELAEAACEIELGDLGRTVGKQDQYAAAHGGVNALSFGSDGSVGVRRVTLDVVTRTAMEERFLLFGAGGGRSAADILAGQVERTMAGDSALQRNLARNGELARAACAALEAGEPDRLGELLDEQWALKRERLPDVAMEPVEGLRAVARGAGAHGATLVGAGGGGFLLVCAPDPERMRTAFTAAGVPELTFGLDDRGCVEE
ncbi:MAG: galactokinase [Thermoleophilaceae bacterium]